MTSLCAPDGDQDGTISGCSCSCPLTGGLTSFAHVISCESRLVSTEF